MRTQKRIKSHSYNDREVLFKKIEIIKEYEQDWDDDKIYFKVHENGWITKIHIETCDVYKYKMERVAH